MTSNVVTLVFMLVSLAYVLIHSYALPTWSDQEQVPTVTTRINRSDQQLSTVKDYSAAKKHLNVGTSTSSHVHGHPWNGVIEAFTAAIASVSKDISKNVVARALSKSTPEPVRPSSESYVSRASSVSSSTKQDSERHVKRPRSTMWTSSPRRSSKKRRLHKTSTTNHAGTVTGLSKARTVSKDFALRSRRKKRGFLRGTQSPDCSSTTRRADFFVTTLGPDCGRTTRRPGCDDGEDGLPYDVTAEDEAISVTDDAMRICDIKEEPDDNCESNLCIDRLTLLIIIVIASLLAVCAISMHWRNLEKFQPKGHVCLQLGKCECRARFVCHSCP